MMHRFHTNWQFMATSLCVALGIGFIRALFPLLVFRPGLAMNTIVYIFLAIFLVPLVTAIFVRYLQFASGFIVTILISLRWLLQLSTNLDLNFALIIMGSIVSLLLLTIHLYKQPSHFAVACLVGLSLDAALNGASLTWDFLWQRNLPATLTVSLLCLLAIIATWQASRSSLPLYRARSVSPIALGAFLLLHLLCLHNVGFIAALTGWSTVAASMLILLADALVLMLSRQSLPAPARIVIGLVLLGLLGSLPILTGIVAAIIVFATHVLSTFFLLSAVQPQSQPQRTIAFAVNVELGALLFIGAISAWMAGYQTPLPDWLPNLMLITVGIFLIAFAVPTNPAFSASRQIALLPVLLVVLPVIGWLSAGPTPTVISASKDVRFMTYNLHQGANTDGWVDLEGLAAVIESQQPQVIVLQEVTRGQLATGSIDMLSWLSARLGMHACYAPAADITYGELLLSKLPIQACSAGRLTKGAAAQYRGYVQGVLELGSGTSLIVIGTHLDHTGSDARIIQTQQLLAIWGKAARTIIAGDMNASPTSAEMQLFEQAGFGNAQDITNHPDLFTYPAISPRSRIDWVFGTPDLVFSDFAILQTTASDHLPVAVTIAVADSQ